MLHWWCCSNLEQLLWYQVTLDWVKNKKVSGPEVTKRADDGADNFYIRERRWGGPTISAGDLQEGDGGFNHRNSRTSLRLVCDNCGLLTASSWGPPVALVAPRSIGRLVARFTGRRQGGSGVEWAWWQQASQPGPISTRGRERQLTRGTYQHTRLLPDWR